jgi:glycosyltransferase involved in cell wall biosynthesis
MTNRVDQKAGKPLRAFVIPVLDYSPASEYSILTLLEDLGSVEGEVVVVFNGTQIGEELKNHPRITRYAIMKQNVGVARAWNIGIHMSEAETVHIVNADAHITLAAVEALEHGLSSLENAVCVGPQGAFVDFNACKDYFYFDKGSFDRPLQVDAVSGFFFAVNQRLMQQHGIAFENSYTPCYYEEWDLGLQAKKAGLACWIVPTTGYDHHWSGTIRALRTIPYLGREETAGEVFERNRQLFREKWTAGDGQNLLSSRYKEYLHQQMQEAIEQCQSDRAEQNLGLLVSAYPDDEEVRSVARYMQLLLAKQRHASNGGGC